MFCPNRLNAYTGRSSSVMREHRKDKDNVCMCALPFVLKRLDLSYLAFSTLTLIIFVTKSRQLAELWFQLRVMITPL